MAKTNSVSVTWIMYYYVKIKGGEMKGVTKHVELGARS